jgi:glycosyltransferase involved in cell wall biosynthesis
MKLAWYSNTPDSPTGYGVQTAQVTRRMKADGHEVHILANYGSTAGIKDWNGITIWPQGRVNYGIDVVDEFTEMAGAEVVFTLYDVWVLGQAWKNKRVLSWTPIDHFPAPPDVLKWCREHETIAMSEYGAKMLRDAGIEPVATIPHAIEPVFQPTESDIRKRMHVPEDAFLVTINAANIGLTPPRKNWGGNLEAMARFMKRHDDVHLYLHVDLASPSGLPLPIIIAAYGLPTERIAVVPTVLYRGGLIDDAELAKIYTASDVLLATSKGEGFGVPVIEALGCGVPSIVSDFSAQPELVGDTGWKVPAQLDWDHNQGANFCTPFTFGIVDALEEAYAQRGQRREACLERAKLYDADRVYAEQWRPLLASLEKPVRIGNTKAAKRRKAKRAA